jgi:serine/threonine protein phosphatase PrpC
MSSNIDMNQIISNINNENNNLKKKNVYDNTNNSFLFDLISNHKKNNSIVTNINIKEKNISLKKITLEKIKSSRSFSNSVDKKINKDKKFSKNNSINKNKYQDNNINSFNSTGNQFYTHLKKIIPSIKNYKIKINDNNNNSINKSSELRNNSLNKSFTTNNFLKRFNLSQYEKPSGKENYFNKRLNTIEHDNDNEQKIKDYFSYIKTNNNNLITNNSNSNKFRKKYKTKSISDISNLDITILNKSRDTILSKNNCSIIENEKELKKKVFKKILKIDSCTIPGYSLTGVKQKNQDSFFLKKNFLSKDEHFFIGICDGHGLFGDLVSQYISETLPLYVKDISKEELIKAFINTNNSLTNNTKIDCSLSGATCTSLIITLDKIICANIGDTRAILAKFENGCYNTVNLSRDHKPTESDEIKRILSEGGVIKQLYDKNKKEYTGPERIWLKNSDIPGLSMSRSFGDNLAHTVGVTYIPEVRIFDYTGGEKFIVIASESVWQYIDSDECVRIVKDYYEKNMDAVGALNSLVTEAIKRLKKEENKIEDITAVVIFFE